MENYNIRGHVVLKDSNGKVLVDKDNMILTAGRKEIMENGLKGLFNSCEIVVGYDSNGTLVDSSDTYNSLKQIVFLTRANSKLIQNNTGIYIKYDANDKLDIESGTFKIKKTSGAGSSIDKFYFKDEDKYVYSSSAGEAEEITDNSSLCYDQNGYLIQLKDIISPILPTETKEIMTKDVSKLTVVYTAECKTANATVSISTLGLLNGETLLTRVTFLPITLISDSVYSLTYTLYF